MSTGAPTDHAGYFHPAAVYGSDEARHDMVAGLMVEPWTAGNPYELLFALQGSVSIELFGNGGNERVPLTAGSLVVVPQGRWHRLVDADDLVELYHTPGQSLGCDDPSTVSENDSRIPKHAPATAG